MADVRDATSPTRRRLRAAAYVVALAAAIVADLIVVTAFALTAACGLFETATAGAGKHIGGLFAVLGFLLGLGELILLAVVAWRRRARIRYVVALPVAVPGVAAATLLAMWAVVRLIYGPTHCESTGLF